jgi:hypothetical protein
MCSYGSDKLLKIADSELVINFYNLEFGVFLPF